MMSSDPNLIFDLLDKLIKQTELRNAHWRATDRPYEWVFQGTNARVRLTSVDRDGDLPVTISILDENSRPINAWNVQEFSDPEEEDFDDRVRHLWSLVSSADDKITSLIRDLDSMPPF
jgi:hypothetical protein